LMSFVLKKIHQQPRKLIPKQAFFRENKERKIKIVSAELAAI